MKVHADGPAMQRAAAIRCEIQKPVGGGQVEGKTFYSHTRTGLEIDIEWLDAEVFNAVHLLVLAVIVFMRPVFVCAGGCRRQAVVKHGSGKEVPSFRGAVVE